MSKEKETLDGELEEITEQNSLGDTCATDKVDYEQMVMHIVPVDNSPKRSKTMRVPLNGKNIVIPRGVAVEIPLKYKLLLDEKEKIRQMDRNYKDKLQEELEAENK